MKKFNLKGFWFEPRGGLGPKIDLKGLAILEKASIPLKKSLQK
jgi:hypothetical protein